MKHTGKVCRGYSGLTVFLCTRVFSFSSLLISCIALYLDMLKDVLREVAMCFIICKCSQHHSLELGLNFFYCFQLCFLFLGKKKKKNLILHPTRHSTAHLILTLALRIGIIILILQMWKWMWNSFFLQVAELGWKSAVSSFKAQTPQPYSVLKCLSKEVANRIDTDLCLKGHFLNSGFSSQGKPYVFQKIPLKI